MKKIVIICIVLVCLIGAGLFLLPGAPGSDEGKEPSAEQETLPEKTAAEKQLESMSLAEKAGQLFLACNSGSVISTEDIEACQPGGYLLFAGFFETRDPETATSDIASLQKSAKVPMLVAADEEGGTVVRISKYTAFRESPFPSSQELYQKGGIDEVLKAEEEKAELLLSLGVNVNLAPVCDLAADKSSFIYQRTLGQDAQATADCISRMVTLSNEKKIGSALKHFPGYGQNSDTHTGIARDTRSYGDFEKSDFLPFKAGIEAGAPCVLVSHNIVECMDKENPASLSKKVHQILRDTLGFEGVIVTDDLSMEGVQGYTGGENLAVAAIQAGNDLLCTFDYKEQLPAVIQAVKDGKLSEEQISQSALRVLEWKERLGLL
ncbi:MAG: beta-hexosaminidase [Firmicutes bacterium]|nr:beta-hexosaminidase [Bacillota bacterium]